MSKEIKDETIVIDDLHKFLKYILKLDSMTYLDRLLDSIRCSKALVGVSQVEIEELSKRKSFVMYLEHQNKKREEILEEIMSNSDIIIDELKKSKKRRAKQNLVLSTMNLGNRFFFRGQYNSAQGMKTSVYRGDMYKHEDEIYHEMLVRCAENFENTNHLEKLVIMQHYGCPTRLFDITSNPLVALYFACTNYGCPKCESIEEGIVYIFCVKTQDMVYADSDRALILSSLPKFSIEDKKELLKVSTMNLEAGEFPKNNEGCYKHEIVERLYHEICREVPAFKRNLVPSDLLQPIFIQPDKKTDEY